MFELFAVWIVFFDTFSNLGVDCFLDDRGDSSHLGREFSDILEKLEYKIERIACDAENNETE